MKIKNLHLVLALLAATGTLFPGHAVNAQDCYELVWSDEFGYNGLPDSTRWTYEVGGGGWGNNELQYYTAGRSENARVEAGNLIIEAWKEAYEENAYTSARLITYQNGHSFKYGKIEARMKLPFGQGIWPAFWMLGDGIFEGNPWPGCGEIDIMEMIGGGSGRDDKTHGTIHWSDANGNHAMYGGEKQLGEGIFAESFHIFSVEWDANSITWFLDGEQYHTVDITPGHLSEFHEDFFILLNIAVGGNWPGYPDATTVFPQKMYVDYVRVYQLNRAPAITGDSLVAAAETGIRYSTVESADFTYAWSVPDGATITGGQGTHSILVDWGCDTGTVSCDLVTLCGEYSLEQKVSPAELEISGKMKVEAGEAGLIYHVPPTGNGTWQWSFPEGVTINTSTDTSSVRVDWGDTEGAVFVRVTNSCGSDSASLEVSVIHQLPYPDPETPHPIPGTIESFHYDTGGEGVAYHDTEAENLGPGSRQDEGVDTEPNDGSENIGWLEALEWLEYTVEVGETGLYDVDIRVGSINSAGRFRILFNGEDRTGNVAVPSTGSWSAFTTITLNGIQLYDTDNLMRIHIVNGQFNMGRLLFKEAVPIGVEDPARSEAPILYPTIADDFIFVKNIDSDRYYTFMDMMGRVVQSGTVSPGSPIAVGELIPGTYYLFLDVDHKPLVSGRFIKTD